MYAPDERIKELYRTDTMDKYLSAEFYRAGQADPFLTVYEGDRFLDLAMEESLSSSENLDFGSCEATQIKLQIRDFPGNIKGSEMVLNQIMDGIYPADDLYPGDDLIPSGYVMPFGKYVVKSAERQAGTEFWNITALDLMAKFDTDVTAWYNALPFPLPLREFRASLCKHIGVTEMVPDYLPNDDMLVDKTVEAATLIGRDVLKACEQANGVFGHFDRLGVLQHVALQPNDRLVPDLDLFPGYDLFPELPGGMSDQTYDEELEPYLLIGCEFEEYIVKSIDKVQIRQEEGDIGALYGDGTNTYTVEGNFLMFGKTAAELAVIAQNIYGMVSGRIYIPYNSESKGLPYIEVGDAVKFSFGGDESIVSYVLKRTLKGVYALKDSYSATGEEIRSVQHDINAEIIQLQGKAAFIVKNVDEVSARVIDLAANTEAQFKVTAEAIESTVKRIGEAESLIRQTADQIELKVSKGDVSAQLSIESGGITIKGNRFSWESTNSSLTADGTLNCKNGIFSGQVTATSGVIGGFEISGNSLVSKSNDTAIRFGNYEMDRYGAEFKNVLIDEDGIYIGSIGTKFSHQWYSETGDLYVNELYIDGSWWNGWSMTETIRQLWEKVFGGGGGCSRDCSDSCSDSCDDSCDPFDLIDDIGGC